MFIRGEWLWIVNGQILSFFDSYLPATCLYFHFRTVTWATRIQNQFTYGRYSLGSKGAESFYNKNQLGSIDEHVLNGIDREGRKLKIASLNVCGLKRRAQYPEFEEFIKNNDIVCLSETKHDETDVISFTGYFSLD